MVKGSPPAFVDYYLMSKVEKGSPRTPRHLKSFVTFFKRYMSTYALVTAALPIPAAAFQLIPTFQAQTKLLSVYTSLFCFLVLGFVFYSRHELTRLVFPEFFGKEYAQANAIRFGRKMTFVIRSFLRAMPLALIVLSLAFAFSYNYFLDQSIASIRSKIRTESGLEALDLERADLEARSRQLIANTIGSANNVDVQKERQKLEALQAHEAAKRQLIEAKLKSSEILKTDRGLIPLADLLILLYIGIFLTAEACFVMMAVKEYAQELLGLSEVALITRDTSQLPAAVSTDVTVQHFGSHQP